MRRTTPNRETRDPQSQDRLNFVESGKPGFEPETIASYRVALVWEEATPSESPEHCGDPAAAARLLHKILSSWDREVMGALLLDTRNGAIGHQLAYIGTLTRAAVEPRGILTAALLFNAAGNLFCHNHPSGDPSPSAEDLAFTRRMAEAGEVVGIRLVDHIIVGEAPLSSRSASVERSDLLPMTDQLALFSAPVLPGGARFFKPRQLPGQSPRLASLHLANRARSGDRVPASPRSTAGG
jgi:DNA repair protein RadC